MDKNTIQEIMKIARPAVIATYGRQPLKLIEYHDRLAYQGKAGLDIYVHIQGRGSEFEVEIERGEVTRIKRVPKKEEIERTETIEPDTPKMREFAAMIRRGVEMYGWETFEKMFVEATGLVLVKEDGGRRYYERPDGEMNLSIGQWSEE